jgi:hypothetical protein
LKGTQSLKRRMRYSRKRKNKGGLKLLERILARSSPFLLNSQMRIG